MSLHPITGKLLELCNGDAQAVRFIEDFWSFCVTWDDLIDRDKPFDNERINNAMLWALFGLNDDPFYQRYPAVLRASIMQCIASWMTANKFEHSGQRDRIEQAYFLRCSPFDVFSTVVLLASGFQKQLAAVEYLHTFAADDRLADYLTEHGEK
jgi:hypothetical protein